MRRPRSNGVRFWGNVELSKVATLMHVEAGRIRRLYAECKVLISNTATSSTAGPPSQLDWEGAPPPRLSQEAMTGMKANFKTNYPGEILNPENTPGPRYWANTYARFRHGAKKNIWTGPRSRL